MGDMGPSDKKVMEKGEHIAVVHSVPSEVIEAWVRCLAILSGQRVDWGYVGGRAYVCALGDVLAVQRFARQLAPAIDAVGSIKWNMVGTKYCHVTDPDGLTNPVMIIMRGLPGSGKSTRAKEFGGEIFSTDDFFMKKGQYNFNIKQIGFAHGWNQKRAREHAETGFERIVIDNTNTTAREMEAYVDIAMAHGYNIHVAEPTSEWWKKNFKKNMTAKQKKDFAKLLAGKNVHQVPEEVILKMIDRWEFDITPESLMTAWSDRKHATKKV